MKYRKLPVEIEAIQFDGTPENMVELGEFVRPRVAAFYKDHFIIATLEGDHRAELGDFIIKGVKGECYPCKPDIFAVTYEAVRE